MCVQVGELAAEGLLSGTEGIMQAMSMGLLPQNHALMMAGNNPAALAMLGQQQAALYAPDGIAMQNVSTKQYYSGISPVFFTV